MQSYDQKTKYVNNKQATTISMWLHPSGLGFDLRKIKFINNLGKAKEQKNKKRDGQA